MGVIGDILANLPIVTGYVVLIINGIIGIALIVPGEQPEKFLQSVVDFISKFSKK